MLVKLAVTTTAALGILAGAAHGASLAVAVAPAAVHPGSRYTITITGRYDKQARPKAPYLLAFIQYSGAACKATAGAEYSLPFSDWDWVFYPQRAEPSARFKSVTYWKAGPRLGTRRACAYLYAAQASPSSTSMPLARASTTFSNRKR